MKKTNQKNEDSQPEIEMDIHSMSNIYVDRIVNIGMSFNVTRLTLAQEMADGTDKAFATLVIPTTRFLDFVQFVSENVSKDDDLKQRLIGSAEQFKDRVINTIAKE